MIITDSSYVVPGPDGEYTEFRLSGDTVEVDFCVNEGASTEFFQFTVEEIRNFLPVIERLLEQHEKGEHNDQA